MKAHKGMMVLLDHKVTKDLGVKRVNPVLKDHRVLLV
jgi:hypothetical protein